MQFACEYPICPALFVKERVFLSLRDLTEGNLIYAQGFISGFCILFYWFICLSIRFNYCRFVTCFEIRKCKASRFVLFKDCFAYS